MVNFHILLICALNNTVLLILEKDFEFYINIFSNLFS